MFFENTEMCNYRAPHTWSELSTRQITVQNSQQDIVFHEEHCDLRHAIMWVWREVLVYADAAGLLLHNNRVSAMIEELRRRGWLAEMRKMIPRGNGEINSACFDLLRTLITYL